MPVAGPITRDVLQTFEDVRSRTFDRLDGLTDAEYLWEPVSDCMTVRATPDGAFRADPRPPRTPAPAPAPVTTIAWRMWHIGADCLRSYLRFFEDDADLGDIERWPGTAAEGIRLLADDWSRFRSQVEGLGDERLLEPMGPRAGAYADETFLLLVLHALDEVAHHGAELGVLRDLYLRQGTP
jgi:hypothetical protein